MQQKNKTFSLENLAVGSLLILVFLLPIFFIPTLGISPDIAKGALLSVIVLLSFIFWTISRLYKGEALIPKSYLLLSGLVVSLIVLISALFSVNITASLIGQGFEIETFSSIATFFVLMFLISTLFQTKKRIFYFYLALIFSFVVLSLFQIIRLIFGVEFLSFDLFTNSASNLIGKWNDLGIFLGLVATMLFIALEMLSFGNLIKTFLYIALAITLFFLITVNFSLIWYIMGFIALIFFVYHISFGGLIKNKEGQSQRTLSGLPISPLIVLVISVIFLFAGPSGSFLANKFNISQIEVRPSWTATFEVAKDTLAQNPVWGGGPNRFANQWLLHKPEGINSLIFWNTSFSDGIGLIPSFLTTTGVLGFLSWLIFFGFLLYRGTKSLFLSNPDKVSHYLVISSFLLATYLWLLTFFYVPNITIFALAFVVTGLFIGSLVEAGAVKNKRIIFLENPKMSFISVLVLIILIVTSISGMYLTTQKFLAGVFFQKSFITLNVTNDIDQAEVNMIKALKLNETDFYLRSMSELSILKLNKVLNQKGLSEDTIKTQLQTILGSAIGNAQKATVLDETNYLNWISLGRVYEAIIPLNVVTGAYDKAKESYEIAQKFNPRGPSIFLDLARLEVANKNIKQARVFIAKALDQKSNYTDAIFFLSQIEDSQGNLKKAIFNAEQAALISPNDVGVFFQLGFLKYKDRDNSGAVSALEKALEINQYYANAKYFLGLTYYRMDRDSDAIAQFKNLATLNPNNKDVKTILKNMKEGENPFKGLSSPLPEKRDNPPLNEEN